MPKAPPDQHDTGQHRDASGDDPRDRAIDDRLTVRDAQDRLHVEDVRALQQPEQAEESDGDAD